MRHSKVHAGGPGVHSGPGALGRRAYALDTRMQMLSPVGANRDVQVAIWAKPAAGRGVGEAADAASWPLSTCTRAWQRLTVRNPLQQKACPPWPRP